MSDHEIPQPADPKSLLDRVLSTNEEELHPWEEAVLPSKGLYYKGAIPGGVVKVKPMGLYADKVMATKRLVVTGEALDHIFRKYVKLPNDFDHLDLLSDDRVFLLYYLRGITHGHEYEFILTCPNCSRPSPQYYDFNDLYATSREPNLELGTEPFEVVLPYLTEQLGQEFWVKVRFLRGHDSMEMLGATKPSDKIPGIARNRRKKKRDKIVERGETVDETLEKNINRIIVEVMGETDRSKIKQLVTRLHSTDIATIMDFVREHSPGIDTMIEADCEGCDTTMTVPLPITESFFRPKKRLRHRE